MIGGGQLARMTHQAAIALGQTLRVLAVDPADPAAQVSPDVVLGSHTDYDALRKVAQGATVITFDHEHVPTEHLDKLVAEGATVSPPPEALVHAQDKLVMRRRLSDLGLRFRASPRSATPMRRPRSAARSAVPRSSRPFAVAMTAAGWCFSTHLTRPVTWPRVTSPTVCRS